MAQMPSECLPQVRGVRLEVEEYRGQKGRLLEEGFHAGHAGFEVLLIELNINSFLGF